ncbi:aspartic proteinase CDR1 [Lactuca sativa]|uniref:aspartic proteinase CDR1 n=1 Tax=Lactuca sativa TaxID=4236 RepID=UPI000CC7850E|nr:aspartic proteinase CDR1 [Lactuca sativa]
MAFPSLVLAITLAILYISSPATATGVESGGTFSIDLIHRDSIKSPFYDGSMTFSQRLAHALQRSFINAKRYKENATTYQTQIIPDHGEFLVNISFGNPSHKVMAIADTGSDLSWIQCKPCIKCYKHKGTLFDPKKSSTYKPLDCDSTICKGIDTVDISCSPTKTCEFFESYADGSFSNGSVSTETLGLGDRFLPNIVFGCGFSNGGIFRSTWGGVIGLGGGDVSLVTQIRSFVPGRFSYCLIPYPLNDDLLNKSSKMTFGDIDFGPNIVSTPLVPKSPKTFYYVTLEAVSVGSRRMNIHDGLNFSKPVPKGNMIVDSGTTLTMLPHRLYKNVEMAIKDSLNLRTMKDPQKQLNLCYRATKVIDVPKVIMHFDGADVELTRDNIFVTVSKHIICLAMGSTTDLPVFGNLAQMNFMVGFDLDNKKVSFKPTDCEKL